MAYNILPISQRDHFSLDSPLVSICVITFNHAFFIKECLDSLLMQEVDFGVEILIHDDASTDATQEILKEYDLKFPGLFKLVLREENIYKKLGGGINPRFNYPRAKGKYIALCEGDDYWTDPFKLQKQVNFLESNDDYVLYGHNVRIVGYEFGTNIDIMYHKDKTSATLTTQEIIEGFKLPTNSLVFRKETWDVKFQDSVQHNIKPQDKWLYLKLSKYGKVFYDSTIMACYRKHPAGAVGSYEFWDLDKHISMRGNQIVFWKNIRKLFFPLYEQEIRKNIAKETYELSLRCAKNNQHFWLSTKYMVLTAKNDIKKFHQLLHALRPVLEKQGSASFYKYKIGFMIMGSKVKQTMIRFLR